MKKYVKIVITTLVVSLVLLGISGYLAINWIAEYALSQLAGAPTLAETKNKNDSSGNANTDRTSPQSSENEQQELSTTEENGQQSSNNEANTQTDEQRASSEDTYDPRISPKKIEQAKETLSFGEKAKITSVLLSKLSASEMNLFVKMATDGVSREEKKEAKKIILLKLTEQEYDELIVLAKKLGLSQGQSYQDSLKNMK